MIWSKYNLFIKSDFKNSKNENYGILYNTLSCAANIVTEEMYNNLKTLKLKKSEKIELYNRKFIYEDTNQEQITVKDFFKKYKIYIKNNIPTTYVIITTLNCNLNCVYCCEKAITNTDNKIITKEQVDSIFDIIEKNKGPKHIQLFGGEPFLKRNYNIIEYILNKNIKDIPLSITSNGVELDYYSNLLKKHKIQISNLQITIDGPANVHDTRRKFINGQGTFDKIIKNIKDIIDFIKRLSIRINIDNGNIHSLFELMNELKKHNLFRPNVTIYLAPVTDVGCTGEYENFLSQDIILDKLLHYKKENNILDNIKIMGWRGYDIFDGLFNEQKIIVPQFQFCEANMKTIVFNVDNEIYPCVSTIHNKNEIIGTLKNNKIDYNKKKVLKWRQHSIFNKNCIECKVALLCGGGCMAFSPKALNEHCNSFQKMINIATNNFFPKIANTLKLKYY